MKKRLLFMIIGILLFPIMGQSKNHVDKQRSVKIGIYHTPPLECLYENDERRCIFRGILDYIAEIEGWDTEYIKGTPGENIERLEKGEIDLISHAIYCKELKEKLTFTKDTIVSTWAQVYAKEKSELQSLLDLAHLSVGVVQNDPYNRELRNIVRQFDVQCKFIEFKTYHNVLQALENKWIDAGVVDRIYGILHAKDYRLLKTAIIFSPTEFRFAVKKNQTPDLINALNYHINMLKKDPHSIYYHLINQTFDIQVDSEVLVYLKWSLYITVSFLLLSTGVAFILKRQIKSKTAQLVRKNEALEAEIPHRRQAEKALEASEERYRSVFENTGTATIIIEKDMTISMVNDRAAELSGYNKAEIQGKMKAVDFMLLEDREIFRRYQSNRNEDGSHMPSEYEFRLMDKKGQVKDVFIRVVTIPETQRRIASLMDITAQKRMEKERLLLATAIEQSSESIFITDPDMTIQYVNPGFEKITGYAKEEVMGQSASFLYAD